MRVTQAELSGIQGLLSTFWQHLHEQRSYGARCVMCGGHEQEDLFVIIVTMM